MATANEIFEHHLSAFAIGDVDEILKDYTNDTVMIYGDRIWHGLEGARDFFNMWLDELLPAGCEFNVIDRHATDDCVYITWTAESEKYKFDYGTDTFLVQNNKFLRQTVATFHHKK